jgi:hypothetical protein
MPLNVLRTRLHSLTITLLLSCVISQPIHATIFNQEPETSTDIVLFTTAVLSLPTHLASIKHPNSKFFSCATHALKAINGAASIADQGRMVNNNNGHPLVLGWFLYDFINIFTSLFKDSAKEKNITEDSDKATNNKQFTTETRYILACIEGALRVAAALYNGTPRVWRPHPIAFDEPHRDIDLICIETQQQVLLNYAAPDTLPWNTHELLYRCVSLFRIIDLYLSKDQGLAKKILFLLLTAHAYAIYRQYDRTQDESIEYARLHGAAEGSLGTAEIMITEANRRRNNQKQAAQTRAVIDH